MSPSLNSHPFTSSGHSNAHAPSSSAHAPAAPSATKPWNWEATDHGAVAPCSTWCATRWRPGQHRTRCCRLALNGEAQPCLHWVESRWHSIQGQRSTKKEKTWKNCHKIHNCNPVRPGLLPTVHLDPGLFSKTHALPKISPRPETKSIAQDAATQKGAEGDLDASAARWAHWALRGSLRPAPRSLLLVLLGVMGVGRGDWWRLWQPLVTVWILRNIWIFQREANRSGKESSRNWVLTSSEHAIAVEVAVRAPMSDSSILVHHVT